jgi:endonuclease-3 related protein
LPRLGDQRLALLAALRDHHGLLPMPDQARDSTPFERLIAVGIGLVAEARVASAALETLRGAGLLEPSALATAHPLELDELFREARVRLTAKALKPLQKIARWASDRDFDSEAVERLSTEAIREAWLGLSGIGPSTADSLLLFGLSRATYPVDRASYRILVRHGWLDPSSDYDEARSALEAIAPDDPESLAQLSMGLERVGRQACKPGAPRCDDCPLRPFLPEGGPIVEV